VHGLESKGLQNEEVDAATESIGFKRVSPRHIALSPLEVERKLRSLLLKSRAVAGQRPITSRLGHRHWTGE
jgi:hypothetical protein